MEWMIMPLKRYADFSGRSRRMEYWMFFLLSILIGIAFGILSVVVGGTAAALGGDAAGLAAGGAVGLIAIFQLVVNLALIIPSLAVGVRRLHDTDRSGWWLLAPVIGYVVLGAGMGMSGFFSLQPGSSPNLGNMFAVIAIGGLLALGLAIMILVFMCLPGTTGPNRFGPDPKNPEANLGDVFS